MESKEQQPLLVSLGSASNEDLAIVGGKAASLIKLHRSGFNVPAACVLTTHVFDKLIASAALACGATTTNSREAATDLLKQFSLPQCVTDSVAVFVEELGKPLFAVRSSAVAEDTVNASFAGLLQTFLDIAAEDLEFYIKLCFASYFSESLAVYRSRVGGADTPGMAVIIQEMIKPDYAGVMFTVDPLAQDSLAVEVVQGCGDKLVSGSVTPAGFRIARQTCDVQASYGSIQVSPDALRELAAVGLRIEHLYGGMPQDIEFAIFDEEIHILQSRPITFFSHEKLN